MNVILKKAKAPLKTAGATTKTKNKKVNHEKCVRGTNLSKHN